MASAFNGKPNQSGPRSVRSSRLLFAGALGLLLLVATACGSIGATAATSTTVGNASGHAKAAKVSVGSSQHGSLGTSLIDQSGTPLYRHSSASTRGQTA